MTEQVVNLDNCAREPIHIPGAIQPHGLLFVLREPDLTILQCSENVADLLDVPAPHLAGKPLSALLSAEQLLRVKFALDSVDPRDNNPVELKLPTIHGGGPLDGFVHRHDGFSFLELEPASTDYNARFLESYKMIAKLTARLHSMSRLTEILNQSAIGIRELTGFDRVMIYRFAENYEGEVVAEAKGAAGEPFLGLWYPASDIPEQARKLYVVNPIRAIVDASYAPARILPVLNPDTNRPTDLSFCGLRSVSPIHCEYLRNMGVTASMSISIVREDRLWGLVACHNFSPRIVPYELRKSCTFIAHVLAGTIARRELEDESLYRSQSTATLAKFLEFMASTADPLLGLVNSSPNLLDLIPCEGAAIVQGGKAQALGQTPAYDEIVNLVELLRRADLPSTFSTNSLKNHFAGAESLGRTASGVIALEVARDPAAYVLFFRPEIAQTVRWGGNPEKPVTASEDGFRLSPRKSFEAWKEVVRAHALPWSTGEIRTAGELRNLISVVLYARGLGR